MKKPIRILIIEDKPDDADLAKYEIRKILSDCEFQIAETREEFTDALRIFQPDVILSDYTLPHFDGMKALELTLPSRCRTYVSNSLNSCACATVSLKVFRSAL